MRNKTTKSIIQSVKSGSLKAASFGMVSLIFSIPQYYSFEDTTRENTRSGWPRYDAFSLVEVQIAMIVLTIGLMGLIATLQTNSRQMEVAESWCRQDKQYYIVSQSNTWMRQTGVPADLTTDSNFTAWEPPVTGEQIYEIELESFMFDYENRTASAQVKLKKI